MNSFVDNLKRLGRARLLILLGIGAAVSVMVGLLTFTATRAPMATVHAAQDVAEAARILSAVEALGIKAEIGPDGVSVRVPSDQVARVRMSLAEQGLPSAGGVGYELFDNTSALGMTSFMQRMNRLRAMEGELARTIMTIRGVDRVRVHLVLPDREAFARDQNQPSASVVVSTRVRGGLDRSQALAIRNLVASAVPGLRPAMVTVMDSTGALLLSDADAGTGSASGVGVQHQVEAALARKVETVLSARLGAGNIRVQVSADIDNTRQVVRSLRYDPNEQVARSTQTVTGEDRSNERNQDGSVSVGQNLPEAQQQGQTSSTQATRTEETTNFEISNTTTERYIEPGSIRRLSVAVLVNGMRTAGADGAAAYAPRPQEELDRIRTLVESAVGFDQQRGDRVVVENLEFVDVGGTEFQGDSFMTILASNLVEILRWLAIIVGIVVIVVFILRPMVERLLGPPLPTEIIPEPLPVTVPPPQVPAPTAATIIAQSADLDDAVSRASKHAIDEAVEQMIEIRAVEGRVRASSIQKLADIVDEFPDESISIIRSWLYEESE